MYSRSLIKLTIDKYLEIFKKNLGKSKKIPVD